MPSTDSSSPPRDDRLPACTLSAILCNYNHGHLISRAIEAIVTQSRCADEFIIVDDGSTDDSVSIIRSWVERHPSVIFLQNERNLGLFESFRRALTTATCDFLYSGAADDRVLPGFFEGAMQMAERYPHTGVVCGQLYSVDPEGRRLNLHGLSAVNKAEFLEPTRYLKEVLNVEPATHSLSPSTIFRRQPMLDVGGFRPELTSWGDTFALQALGLRFGYCYWPHPAAEWTVMPGGISQTTKADPVKAYRIVDRAEKLMRSVPHNEVFPPHYVAQWSGRYRRAVAEEQLVPLMEAIHVVQIFCRSGAATASLPIRLTLEFLRFGMKAIYFVMFRLLRRALVKKLVREAADKSACVNSGIIAFQVESPSRPGQRN